MGIEPPPFTRIAPVEEVLHGVRVVDPYRWLEDDTSPDVQDWARAQDARTRRCLGTFAERGVIASHLQRLLSIGVLGSPLPRRGRLFFERRTGLEEQPILYVREGLFGEDRVLLDPLASGKDGTTALDWYQPSPDGRLLAYGLSEGGTEQSTLRVKDVTSGAELEDLIPFTRACSLAWRPDSSGFLYTRYPEPGSVPKGEENYHRHVFDHHLGADWNRDAAVFGKGRPAADWPSVQLSPNGRWLVISVSRGWTRTDVYLADLQRGAALDPIVEGEEVVVDAIVLDERLYLRTNYGAPRYHVVEVDPLHPRPEAWRELIPEGEDVLEHLAVVGDSLIVHSLRKASSRLALFDRNGVLRHPVELPAIGTVSGLSGEWDGNEAFFGFSSFATPPAVFRIPLPEGPCDLWGRVEVDVDPEAYTVRLAHTHSRDGARVSLFLVHRKDRASDGRGAALLTGYGGFNVSLTPAFGRSLLLFLEAGGLYAVAHLRGGGEYGEDWHQAGMAARKQNVFDDFISVAEFLLAAGHAARDRLGIIGGSNGGLLVGAALTQRPELFAAAVCQVPLLDMLRYHLFRIARLWIPEYGSAEDPAAFPILHAYSPYHRVRDGVAYPALLLTTGEDDSRVDPLHARKMAARLQAASTRLVLLRVETRAGHGQGKPLSKVVEEATDIWTFLFATLRLSLRGNEPGAGT